MKSSKYYSKNFYIFSNSNMSPPRNTPKACFSEAQQTRQVQLTASLTQQAVENYWLLFKQQWSATAYG